MEVNFCSPHATLSTEEMARKIPGIVLATAATSLHRKFGATLSSRTDSVSSSKELLPPTWTMQPTSYAMYQTPTSEYK